MVYANAELVRKVLDVDSDDASDDLLNTFLTFATKQTFKNIAVPVVNEDLEQKGKELNYFMTKHKYIADKDFDKLINTSDIEVYYWDDNYIKKTLTVSSIVGSTGQIVLASVPTSAQDVRIDYYYYTAQVDWDLIDLATAYYAAFMWAGRELYLVPPRYFLGDLRINAEEPWKNYKDVFDEIVMGMNNVSMSKVDYDRMVVYPRQAKKVSAEAIWWYKLTGLLE